MDNKNQEFITALRDLYYELALGANKEGYMNLNIALLIADILSLAGLRDLDHLIAVLGADMGVAVWEDCLPV